MPVGRSEVRTRSVRTPASPSDWRSSAPYWSSPSAPSNATDAPRQAAATAVFAPLPPGTTTVSAPSTVSPAPGRRCTATTRSALADPTTTISAPTRDLLSRRGRPRLTESRRHDRTKVGSCRWPCPRPGSPLAARTAGDQPGGQQHVVDPPAADQRAPAACRGTAHLDGRLRDHRDRRIEQPEPGLVVVHR